jgi:hypothetical protein
MRQGVLNGQGPDVMVLKVLTKPNTKYCGSGVAGGD